MKHPGLVKCPSCRKEGRWFEGAFGPFCSKRCKLIDLGKWFGEEHAISEPLSGEQLERGTDTDPETDRKLSEEE